MLQSTIKEDGCDWFCVDVWGCWEGTDQEGETGDDEERVVFIFPIVFIQDFPYHIYTGRTLGEGQHHDDGKQCAQRDVRGSDKPAWGANKAQSTPMKMITLVTTAVAATTNLSTTSTTTTTTIAI